MQRNIFHIYFKQKFILNLLWSHCISRNTHFWTHIYLHYLRVVWFCKKGSLFCQIILKKILKKNIFLLLLLKIKKTYSGYTFLLLIMMITNLNVHQLRMSLTQLWAGQLAIGIWVYMIFLIPKKKKMKMQ